MLGLRVCVLSLIVLMLLSYGLTSPAYADTLGSVGVSGFPTYSGVGYWLLERVQSGSSGTLTSITIYTSGASGSQTGRVAIYADSAGNVGSKLGESADGTLSTGTAVQTTFTSGTLSSVSISSSTYYWLVFELSGSSFYYRDGVAGKGGYCARAYGSFPDTLTGVVYLNLREYGVYATYSTAPPGPDFTITPSPASQSVGAGSTASFTLDLAALNGFTETVTLSVTSGCPSGVTCTVSPTSVSSFPGSSTLSVPTLITTSGSYSVVVTASGGGQTHTATVSVSVSGAAQYSFNVKSGATQIVVTLTYAWSGSGTPPAGSITIVGPGGTPQYGESSGAVYDRTSIAVSGSSSAYTVLHRVTFTVSGITSPQVWTALVSLASVSTYNVTIEVS